MNILFLQKRVLYPLNTGCRVRNGSILQHLVQRHNITYVCNESPGDEPAVAEMRRVGMTVETVPWPNEVTHRHWKFFLKISQNLLSPLPYTVVKDFDSALRARVQSLLNSGSFDLLICDFVQMALNCRGLSGCPQLLFQHNVETQLLERYARTTTNPMKRWMLELQARKMHQFEMQSGREFQHVIAISEPDAKFFREKFNWSHVSTIDTGADLNYYRPHKSPVVPGRIVFVGSLDWQPNENAIAHFVANCWPAIRAACPQATFQAIGRNPRKRLQQLERIPGVKIIGNVPDVRPYVADAAVSVVPLLAGSGTRLKIIEALAMGKAIVSTSLGAEGLKVAHGEHLLIADRPAEFSAAVIQLLKNTLLRQHFERAARELVEAHFSSEKIAAQFEEICERTACVSNLQPRTTIAAAA